jgi:hypothetical protein
VNKRLMIFKTDEKKWVHATREDVAKYQPWLLRKGLKVWIGKEWTPIGTTLKEEN